MGEDRIRIEWLVTEDEQAWQMIQRGSGQQEPIEAAPATLLEWRVTIGLVVLILLLVGVWNWQSQVKLAAVVNELKGTIARETSTVPLGIKFSSSLLAGQSMAASTQTEYPRIVQLDEYHLKRERAMAQVTARYPIAEDGVLSYRETRFYQHTAEGWVRVEPVPEMMGPWQTLETEHFLFHYHAINAQMMKEAAPQLDSLYEQMRRDFGLPMSITHTPIIIMVVTDRLPEKHAVSFSELTIRVPSPVLLRIPMEYTAASVFYQSLVYPLASLMVREIEAQSPRHWRLGMKAWQPVVDALLLWKLWEDGGPLAMGHEDIIRWLYENAQASPDSVQQRVPDTYNEICRMYSVWNLTPNDVGIPLTCTQADRRHGSPTLQSSGPTHLGGLFYVANYHDSTEELVENTVALETVIAYSVATYGRDRIAVLIDKLDKHVTWQTLIPAAFGVSAAEFEVGWRSYLVEQYKVSLDN